MKSEVWSLKAEGLVFVTPQESLTKISTENAQQYVASGEDLIGDRLRLDILTKILKKIYNL